MNIKYYGCFVVCLRIFITKLFTVKQTIKIVDDNFKSFFSLIRKSKLGEYKFPKIKLPCYLRKEAFFSLVSPTSHIRFKEDFFYLPMLKEFKEKHGRIKFRVPPNIGTKSIKEIRILPKYKARFFEIEFVYKKQPKKNNLNHEKFLGVDFGIDNLATCVTSDGAAFIVDGKSIKSYNRLYNKINARLQTPKDKQGIKSLTRRQYLNLRKRNKHINHAMHRKSNWQYRRWL